MDYHNTTIPNYNIYEYTNVDASNYNEDLHWWVRITSSSDINEFVVTLDIEKLEEKRRIREINKRIEKVL